MTAILSVGKLTLQILSCVLGEGLTEWRGGNNNPTLLFIYSDPLLIGSLCVRVRYLYEIRTSTNATAHDNSLVPAEVLHHFLNGYSFTTFITRSACFSSLTSTS